MSTEDEGDSQRSEVPFSVEKELNSAVHFKFHRGGAVTNQSVLQIGKFYSCIGAGACRPRRYRGDLWTSDTLSSVLDLPRA